MKNNDEKGDNNEPKEEKINLVTKEDFDRRIESVGESRCREEGGEYVRGYCRHTKFTEYMREKRRR